MVGKKTDDPSKGIGVSLTRVDEQKDLGKRIGTKVVHAGEKPDPCTRGVVTPLNFSTTYAFDKAQEWAEIFYEGKPGYVYSRHANPTRAVFENKIALLEGGEAGIGFSSGMAAIASSICSFASPGDELIVIDRCYPGTRHFLNQYLAEWGFVIHFVDARETENVVEKVSDKTKIIYMESPTNPTLSICDIPAITQIAKENDIKFLFDNTFASPINQLPLNYGADVVIHSVTKYLSGHSDVLGGAIVTTTENRAKIMNTAVYFGGVMPPFDAWLTIRGMKTLELRIKRHNENAQAIAEFLEDHPKITTVYYPGLKTHPHHNLAKKIMKGFGGLVSFCVGKSDKDGERFINALNIIKRATSLGSVESLAQASGSMIYREFTDEQKRALGILPGFIRLSTGIEDKDDLIEDIDSALKKI